MIQDEPRVFSLDLASSPAAQRSGQELLIEGAARVHSNYCRVPPRGVVVRLDECGRPLWSTNLEGCSWPIAEVGDGPLLEIHDRLRRLRLPASLTVRRSEYWVLRPECLKRRRGSNPERNVSCAARTDGSRHSKRARVPGRSASNEVLGTRA